MPGKSIPEILVNFEQIYRKPPRYADKIVLASAGLIFMVYSLATAPSARDRPLVPEFIAGIGSYVIAAIVAKLLRAIAVRHNVYRVPRRVSMGWTSSTRDYWLAASVVVSVGFLILDAWLITLTAEAKLSELQGLASAAAAFAIFLVLPGYWELEKLIAPRKSRAG